VRLEQAEALAARVLVAIDQYDHPMHSAGAVLDADRERVASDLAGIRDSARLLAVRTETDEIHHARRYADGLLRTARLYGVEVES
jgi:hypothetical protein